MFKIIILILQLLFSIGAIMSAYRWLDHVAVKESKKMPTNLKTNNDFADGYEKGRADAIDKCIAIVTDDRCAKTCPYAFANCTKCMENKLKALKGAEE